MLVSLILLFSCHSVSPTDTSTDTIESENNWRSKLYQPDWTPDFTLDDGHFLHDFSYAGYMNSNVEIPELAQELFSVMDYGADPTGITDSTAAFMEAINSASVMGGVVWIAQGLYRIDGVLEIAASGVVLAGEGPQKSRLWFTKDTSMTDGSSITFRGDIQLQQEFLLAEDLESRTKDIMLANADGLLSGMDVSVGWVISDAFVEEHQMTNVWNSFNGMWKPFFRREVTSVDGTTVTLDVPSRYVGKVRDGLSLRVEEGYLSQCGIQDLAVSNAIEFEQAWEYDRAHAIQFIGVKDCWVKNVHSFADPNEENDFHLQSGGILVHSSKRVTVADSVMEKPQNRGAGGNGYLFEVSKSSEVLIHDCIAREGRHNFIQNWDFGTSGTVFLRTHSSGGRALQSSSGTIASLGASEFHHSLAMANLIDNSEVDDGWKAVNRMFFSSGAGHSATENVFWNLRGEGILVSLQYGRGYVIGTSGLSVDVTVHDVLESSGTSPEDFTEGIDEAETLLPQSLFEDQLLKRLSQ
jgi:hypothetical protein